MAADLHIHVLDGVTEEDIVYFQYPAHMINDERYMDIAKRIMKTPAIWIGEVSWLKAMLFDNNDEFVPGPVGVISDIIGKGCIVLTHDVLRAILAAFAVENTTDYAIAEKNDVEQFLTPYIDRKIFTVNW